MIELLKIQNSLNFHTGFGQLIINLCNGLSKYFKIKIPCGGLDGLGNIINFNPSNLFDHKNTANIEIACLRQYKDNLLDSSCKEDIFYTMWEVDRLSTDAINYLKRHKLIFVPCGYNLNQVNNLELNIYKIPVIVDTDIYKYSKIEPKEIYTFGCGGDIRCGDVRKRVRDTVICFLRAFPKENDVRLLLKPSAEMSFADPRVISNSDILNNIDMFNWYKSIDCFVSISRGEGWGLMTYTTMLTGRPIISPLYGGLTEYFIPNTGLQLEYKICEAAMVNTPNKSYWADVSLDDTIDKMRWAYHNRDQMNKYGENAAKHISSTFDNDVIIKTMVDHIKNTF